VEGVPGELRDAERAWRKKGRAQRVFTANRKRDGTCGATKKRFERRGKLKVNRAAYPEGMQGPGKSKTRVQGEKRMETR